MNFFDDCAVHQGGATDQQVNEPRMKSKRNAIAKLLNAEGEEIGGKKGVQILRIL
jgi:hypothetical protein